MGLFDRFFKKQRRDTPVCYYATLTNEGIQLTTPDGKVMHMPSSDEAYDAVRILLEAQQFEEAAVLMDRPAFIKQKFGDVEVDAQYGVVTYKGEQVHNTIVNRILDFAANDEDFAPLARFLERIQKNPSASSVREGYDFLAHRGLPITEDGCFMAYKGITNDWKDHYTRTVDNSIGAKPRMERNQVDDDRRQECSNGYHVGAYSYASQFGSGRVVLVKVDPADIVSVPLDYDATKMRVCAYEVVSEVTSPPSGGQPPLQEPVYRGDIIDDDEYCDWCGEETEDCWCDECGDVSECY